MKRFEPTMRADFLQVMKERGFIHQLTDEGYMVRMFVGPDPVSGYAGFDATADSLHIGHLIPIIGLAHLQRCGHRPIVLVGGATTMIGDPSGKTELRKMLGEEEISANIQAITAQLARFIDFDRAILVNNADWLRKVSYIDFLRDIGSHFSVNRMLTQDSVKLRFEKGLSFIEFNYMILQAYDFAMLCGNYGCILQMGGSDQWGNIVMGIELVRRLHDRSAYGLTFPLIMTSSGKKMGKTEQGAVWLDGRKTTPYEFYQYWINCDDADVGRFLSLYTFLPQGEIEQLCTMQGADLRLAKQTLAYAVTELVHGKDESDKAVRVTQAAFGGGTNAFELPSSICSRARLGFLTITELLVEAGLVSSKGEARRLIQQGGLNLNEARLDSGERILSEADFPGGALLLRLGKKRHHRVVLE